MKVLRSLPFALLLLATGSVSPATSKTVVCVDGGSDPALSSYEGAISPGLTVPPDVVHAGGTLADCLADLVKGDKLIIIAHGAAVSGTPNKTTFTWQGVEYDGFGAGPGKFPLPPAFTNLNNISVTFGSCYSGLDPDGTTGPQVPLTQRLLNAMKPNAGNQVTGFKGRGGNETIPTVGTDDNSPTQIAAAQEYLAEHRAEWQNQPPGTNKRSPRPVKDQQKEAQKLVDAHFPNKTIPVTIRYTPVRDDNSDPFNNHIAARQRIAGPDSTTCPDVAVIYQSGHGPAVPGATPLVLMIVAAVLLGGGCVVLVGKTSRA